MDQVLSPYEVSDFEHVCARVQDDSKFFTEDGLPRTPFPRGWKGESGLYVAGLGRKGLLGASFDAKNIAQDIAASFKLSEVQSLRVVPFQQRC